VPLCKILIGIAVTGPLAFGRRLRGARTLYRLFGTLHPWSMMEIFLLGVLVAYTKLMDLATVEFGISMFCFVALIVVMIMADAAVDPHHVWERLAKAPRVPVPSASERGALVGCHACHLLCRLPAPGAGDEAECPRCGAVLHRRKPDSLARTSALLITAAILYIPANVYPVMTFSSLGSGEPSTILGGVEELIAANMWPLAAIVFTASILVPVLKLISMTYLVLSTRYRSRWRLKDRTRIYRLNEFVGRWSMVDVFVITLLVALVQLGSIATIVPGEGIVAFAGVVVLTMLAALSFDPRLMWDAAGLNPASTYAVSTATGATAHA
jgi:paraquat-inducible protein A